MSRGLLRGGLKGEKAIAGPDEDSVTMAVAAVLDCLNGVDRGSIDGLFFTSTTGPYKEKQIATIIAATADLRRDILTADFTNSLRAGTTAVKVAADAVKAGSAKKVIVVAADTRLGSPESDAEVDFGDGAAAVLVGDDEVAVELEASHSISNELIDVWRTEEDKFVRFWEERFAQTQGYLKVVPEAIHGVLDKSGRKPEDFSKLVVYAPNPRRGSELCRKVGFDPNNQLQDSLYGLVGNTGTAYPLMLLIAALEEAKAGDRLLLSSYGNGSDAFALLVTEGIEKIKGNRRGIAAYLGSKRLIPDYNTYLKWRKLMPKGMVIEKLYFWTYPSAPPISRERNRIYPLHGTKCKTCGTVQYPPQRVCAKCHTKDNFDEVRLSDKKATLQSFSHEPATGQLIGLVNFDEGGRMWCNIGDTDYEELKIGMPMEMSFREVFYDLGIHDYFWKAVPVRV
jgi:hydroxymethylglutaryl-CoA synthase